MPSKSGNSAVENTTGMVKQVRLNITFNDNPLAPTISTAQSSPDFNLANVDLVTANGAGTLCPEFTFSGINTTTAPVIGIEILDGEATRLLGGYGVMTSNSGAGNAGVANPAGWTIQQNAAVVTSGTVGGVTNKGNIVAYATLVGAGGITTVSAGAGSGTMVLVVEYV